MVLDLCIKFLLPESYQINHLLTLLASVRLVAAALSCDVGAWHSARERERRGQGRMAWRAAGRAIKEWNCALNKSF